MKIDVSTIAELQALLDTLPTNAEVSNVCGEELTVEVYSSQNNTYLEFS